MLATAALCGGAVAATTFPDATGDVAVGSFPHIDISSVQVSNTATSLTFQIFLAGNPVATDWGKYMIGISTGPGGDTSGNGWTRPISMQDGMQFWIGSWVDSGNGAQLWQHNGSWTLTGNSVGISKDTNSVTLSLDFANLGLSLNDTFTFDVYSSGGGGGDGAVDALSVTSASINNWGDSYQTTTSNALSYTLIPEPSAALLGGIGLLALLRRRR